MITFLCKITLFWIHRPFSVHFQSHSLTSKLTSAARSSGSSHYNIEEQPATAMSDGDWDADEYDAPSTVAPVQKSLYADEDADEDVKVRDMLHVTPSCQNDSC